YPTLRRQPAEGQGDLLKICDQVDGRDESQYGQQPVIPCHPVETARRGRGNKQENGRQGNAQDECQELPLVKQQADLCLQTERPRPAGKRKSDAKHLHGPTGDAAERTESLAFLRRGHWTSPLAQCFSERRAPSRSIVPRRSASSSLDGGSVS